MPDEDLQQPILQAIAELGEDAYAIQIRKRLWEIAKRMLTYGDLYRRLAELEQRGLVVSSTTHFGSKTRRGLRKRFYKLVKHA